jgi:hypothetical protein
MIDPSCGTRLSSSGKKKLELFRGKTYFRGRGDEIELGADGHRNDLVVVAEKEPLRSHFDLR